MAVNQPFTDEEVEQIAAFASISPEKVRGVAWLTMLKVYQQNRESTDAALREVFSGTDGCAS